MPTTRVGPSSLASWRVRWINAAFDTLYTPNPNSARRPPTDAMLTMTPGRCLEGQLPRLLRPEQRSAEVDLERLVELRRGDVERGAEVRVGGRVVDEDVEAAEAGDRRLDARPPGLEVAAVRRVHVDRSRPARSADLVGGRVEHVPLARADHHRRAGRDERGGDRLTDATGAPGDERDLAVERDLHWAQRSAVVRSGSMRGGPSRRFPGAAAPFWAGSVPNTNLGGHTPRSGAVPAQNAE